MKLALLVLTIVAIAGAQPAGAPRPAAGLEGNISPMSKNPNLPSQVTMIMLGVENIARSVEFYRDTLALELRNQTGEFAFFAAGGITLALGTPLGHAVQPRPGATEIIFPVESVDTAHELLVRRGCKFINEVREVTPGSWAVTLIDPDGHRLTLLGPK